MGIESEFIIHGAETVHRHRGGSQLSILRKIDEYRNYNGTLFEKMSQRRKQRRGGRNNRPTPIEPPISIEEPLFQRVDSPETPEQEEILSEQPELTAKIQPETTQQDLNQALMDLARLTGVNIYVSDLSTNTIFFRTPVVEKPDKRNL